MQADRFDIGNRTVLACGQTAPMDAVWLQKKFAENPEKSQADLARFLGLTPVQISKMVGGTRRIRADEVTKISTFFDPQIEHARAMFDAPRAFQGPDTIPVMGTAEGGPDGELIWSGEVIERVPRPPALFGVQDAYALYVVSESMRPRYMHGSLIYVHPHRPVPLLGHGVFQLRSEGHGMRALVKQLVKRSSREILLHQYNPDKDIPVPTGDMIAMHRIVASED